jgi:hypothetical protein
MSAPRADSRVLCAVACAALFSCAAEVAEPSPHLPIDRNQHPLAGLYTPGSTLGHEPAATAVDTSAGGLSPEEQREIEGSIATADMQDRCAPPLASPGTSGSLTISFQSDTYGGFYEPANCGAVWIEDTDGNYVATADVWAQRRLRNIYIWQARRCETDAPDVVSSATLETHEQHEVTWDGTDLTGELAPDGPYVLNIEVTEDELNYGRRAEFTFEKGEAPVMLEPADTESVLDLVMKWTPDAEATP